MNFVAYTFLFVFMPMVLTAYYAARGVGRNVVLLLSSYLFYAWWRLDFLALLLLTTGLDYLCAGRIAATEDAARRKGWLIFSVTANLGVLGYFKYFNFGIETLNHLLGTLGWSSLDWPRVLLPIGISFYTFESMSYTIDIYRRRTAPARSLFHYASFIALFPHLVAGPIIRFADIGPQLLQRTHSVEKFGRGVLLFMIGFSKKLLIADSLAPLATVVFDGSGQGLVDSWLGVFAYSMQLYFDFSGYSDMAIGLACMFGLDFPQNFDSPYRSRSITEFWRRWHMSLSKWLRDYLYISLGGNRKGEGRTYVNLFLTMLLGGLWHGASWMFALWGGYHGVLLALERLRGKRGLINTGHSVMDTTFCFLLVMVGWAIFRAHDLGMVTALFGAGGGGGWERLQWTLRPFTLGALAVAPILVWACPKSWQIAERQSWWKALVFSALFVLALVKMIFASFSPFLYYQF